MSTSRESTCPSDEQIAASLDGRLSGPERDQVEAHLASCPLCYQVFKEAAEVLEDVLADTPRGEPSVVAAGPLPPTAPPPPSLLPRRLALAAAVLAAVLGGIALYRVVTAPESISTIALIAPLAGQEGDLVDHLFEGRLRGGHPERSLLPDVKWAVELGVRWVDLAVACRARDASAVDSAVADIEDLWARLSSTLEAGRQRALVSACEGLDHRERTLERSLRHLAPDFSLGRWAEAGRLAAVARSGTFFAPGSPFRAQLERIRVSRAQRLEVKQATRSVSEVLDRPERAGLGESDFSALDAELKRLILAFVS
ncbi:MAG TPA: zf-HC2 domain-containing protein [Thermoanaerobaculia bacterium]|nr:zf-HC2 domain-containing protein [Thermoanaerobaculia bacterium]